MYLVGEFHEVHTLNDLCSVRWPEFEWGMDVQSLIFKAENGFSLDPMWTLTNYPFSSSSQLHFPAWKANESWECNLWARSVKFAAFKTQT